MIRKLTVADIPELERVQVATLPGSLPLAFGSRFFRVYCEALLADPRFFADGFFWEGRLAGFLTYTSDSSALLAAALRRRLAAFATSAAIGSLTSGTRMASALRALGGVLTAGREPGSDVRAELLSYGVLPEFRRASAFYAERRIHVAQELLHGAFANLYRAGAPSVKIFIQPDPFIQRFYAREGFHYIGFVRRFGLHGQLGVRELSASDGMARTS